MTGNDGAVLAQQGEFVELAGGAKYEIVFNMRALVELERKYGTMAVFSLAAQGGNPEHGMLDAMIDGLAYGLKHLKYSELSDPNKLIDKVALGRAEEYIRAVTRAINIALTGSPDDGGQADEGWSDLPADVRGALLAYADDANDGAMDAAIAVPLVAYVKRHTPAEVPDTDGGETPGNSPGASGTGS